MSYGRRYPIQFIPPMRGIVFTATESEESGSQTLALKARGTDGVGEFKLYGDLTADTGNVNMFKKYVTLYAGQGPLVTWRWSLFMSPFGLVGSWGNRKHSELVWLWKKIEKQFPKDLRPYLSGKRMRNELIPFRRVKRFYSIPIKKNGSRGF